MANGEQYDPAVMFRYELEIVDSDVQAVRFNEVQGIKSVSTYESVREGGNNLFERALINPNKYEDLVIKKGFYTVGSEFYTWMRKLHVGVAGKHLFQRHDLELRILNSAYETTGTFYFYNAFPVEYEGPSFSAMAKEIAFESIKIHYDFFEYHPGNEVMGLLDAGFNAIRRQF